MARRRNYRRRFRGGARRVYVRYGGRARRAAIASAPYMIGAGASFIPQVNAVIPPQGNAIITALAVAPSGLVRGRTLGKAKAVCQGYVAGKVLQSFIGNPLSGMLGGGGNGPDPTII